MAWYYILFFTALIFFVIKFLLTLIAGDVDFDVDIDGDVDFDMSSLFSFKGVLHFILGFSTYLSLIARYNTNGNEVYTFNISQYIIGICIGLIFSIGLFYLYKLMMKFNHYNNSELDLNGYTCTILGKNSVNLDSNEHSYYVLVNTPVGSRKINVLSFNDNLTIGGEYKIFINEQGIYCI